MQPLLTFVHITDTHIGSSLDYDYYGLRPPRYLARLVAEINGFPQQPDFVIHTGDVSQDRSAESYEIALEQLGKLNVPVYYVNGNHDDRALLRKMMGAPGHASGNPDAPLDYVFEVRGERFLVLDAHHEDAVPDPQGFVTDEQLAWVQREAMPDGPPLTVFVHFPLFRMASPWLNDNMLICNGNALHAALLPARNRLRGVFLGHLHRSCQIVRDDICYTTAASSIVQYAWRPWDARPQSDHDFAPGYNVVQYFADQVIVLQYAFTPPGSA